MYIWHMGKYLLFLIGFLVLSSCENDKVPIIQNVTCQLKDTVSYAQDIAPILTANCFPCHQYPGSGGINLDNYTNSKSIALSGQLVQSIIHDPNYVTMPPPPQKELDSCQIKDIKQWVAQGCLDN